MNASHTRYHGCNGLAFRLVASITAVGVTAALLSSVIAPAMQQQSDGSLRLAHATVGATPSTQQALVALADAKLV